MYELIELTECELDAVAGATPSASPRYSPRPALPALIPLYQPLLLIPRSSPKLIRATNTSLLADRKENPLPAAAVAGRVPLPEGVSGSDSVRGPKGRLRSETVTLRTCRTDGSRA
jgi:hypothetical protein